MKVSLDNGMSWCNVFQFWKQWLLHHIILETDFFQKKFSSFKPHIYNPIGEVLLIYWLEKPYFRLVAFSLATNSQGFFNLIRFLLTSHLHLLYNKGTTRDEWTFLFIIHLKSFIFNCILNKAHLSWLFIFKSNTPCHSFVYIMVIKTLTP